MGNPAHNSILLVKTTPNKYILNIEYAVIALIYTSLTVNT